MGFIDKTDGISLRTAFLSHAAKRPDAPAVVARGVTLSYGQMEQKARQWAQSILAVSARQPERVGLFTFRSDVAYTGTMAALFSGSTFVPLNPTFPAEKTAAMIAQADLDAIIVDKSCAPQLSAVLGQCKSQPPLLLPELPSPQFDGVHAHIVDQNELERQSALANLPPLVPDDIAYLLFTSGSTGAPKGVPVTHGNAVHFMTVMSERYGLGPEDRLSQTFDQTFDLSVFDMFMAWTNGACLYSLTPVELLAPTRFINKNELTVWFSVPSLPAQMIRRGTLKPASLPTLRWSLFCGEPLTRGSAEAWQEAAPNSIVENLYGPTELTIACLVHRWDSISSPAICRNDIVPIGRPYSGLGAVLLDETLQPVPEGEIGELCVSGPQTTPGYWQDPERTAERYVQIALTPSESRRFYRTGDRVGRLENGDYVYYGRTDHQIKVLGHRVELGEIEATLRRGVGVEHAIAAGWPLSATGSADGIVAFVSGNDIDPAALTDLAKASLPPYCVPQKIILVPEMPLNANGKVDRKSLQSQLKSS